MKVYAIRFPNDTYYGSQSWLSGITLESAKFFAKIGTAKAIANNGWHKREGAVVVSFELTEVPA